MKTCILFDHDGVLVDTEPWYYRAGERALADIGVRLDEERYLRDMAVTKEEALVVEDSVRGLRSALAAGIDCAIVDNAFTRGHDFTGARHRIGSLIELKDIVISPT